MVPSSPHESIQQPGRTRMGMAVPPSSMIASQQQQQQQQQQPIMNVNMNMNSKNMVSPVMSPPVIGRYHPGLLAAMHAQQLRHCNMRMMNDSSIIQMQMGMQTPFPPPPPLVHQVSPPQVRPSIHMHKKQQVLTSSMAPMVVSPLPAKSTVSKSLPSKQKQIIPLPESFEPGPTTVVLGRERLHEYSGAVGNVRMEIIAGQYLAEYSRATSKEVKSKIVTHVVDAVQGMFVKSVNGRWYEADDISAREEVTSFFRNKLPNKYRSSSQAKHAKRKYRKMMEEDTTSCWFGLEGIHFTDPTMSSESKEMDHSKSSSVVSHTQTVIDSTLDMMESSIDDDCFPPMSYFLEDDEVFHIDEDDMIIPEDIFSY
jgi:hypothetical protein